MMKKLILFGQGFALDVALYNFENDSDYQVVAICKESSFIKESHVSSFPVVAFETIEKDFPPDTHSFFNCIGYSKLNSGRQRIYNASKKKGYQMASYISSKAVVLSKNIGEHVYILENNTIQPFVQIGSNVILWGGSYIAHHSTIGDNTFIASHVIIAGNVTIGENCFLGINSTIRDNITIGKKNIIGAGSIILKNTPDEAIFLEKATEQKKTNVPIERAARFL